MESEAYLRILSPRHGRGSSFGCIDPVSASDDGWSRVVRGGRYGRVSGEERRISPDGIGRSMMIQVICSRIVEGRV